MNYQYFPGKEYLLVNSRNFFFRRGRLQHLKNRPAGRIRHLFICISVTFLTWYYLQLYFHVWQQCQLQSKSCCIFIMLITYVHQFSCPYMLCVVCKYSVTKSRARHFHRKCLLWNFSLEVCFSLQLWSIWHPALHFK